MQRARFVSLSLGALAGAGCASGAGVAPAGSLDATDAPLDHDQKILLDQTRQIAAKLLIELGAFPPLAITLDPHGKPLLVTNDVDPSLTTAKKVELLAMKLHAIASHHAIRAVGIVVNGQIDGASGRVDAALISIEEDGHAPRGFAVPYRMQGKRVAFADPQPLRARAIVFASK